MWIYYRISKGCTAMECDESEVVRYYLKCELGKCFKIWKQPDDFVYLFERGIGRFPDENAVKLMRFLSGPECRNNGLYHYLGRGQYRWEIEKVDIEMMYLPPINVKVDAIIDKFNRNLAMFVDFLREGGGKHKNLCEFRDDGRKIHQQRVISLRVGDRINIIDGAHRAVILALRGATCIETYLAYKQLL